MILARSACKKKRQCTHTVAFVAGVTMPCCQTIRARAATVAIISIAQDRAADCFPPVLTAPVYVVTRFLQRTALFDRTASTTKVAWAARPPSSRAIETVLRYRQCNANGVTAP